MSSKTPGRILTSDFKPVWWAKNRHIQTIWPRFLQRRLPLTLQWQRLELPDGDFVDLSWAPEPQNKKGMAVLFHGLEGSARSHYAHDMLAVLAKNGWHAVMMHFRGCGNGLNRLPRTYHSGDTQDAMFFLNWLQKRFPEQPKMGIGFSLGANMLLKLLGENPAQQWLKSAVAISPPFRLADCAAAISRGFSNNYQKYLLKSMVNKVRAKMQRMDFKPWLSITEQELPKIQTFAQFDQFITAPLHGFSSVDDYYQRCSASAYTPHITTPTLILHAKDDPFMSESVVPKIEELSGAVSLELSENGGHVGFMQGSPWRPRIWSHQRVLNYFADFID